MYQWDLADLLKALNSNDPTMSILARSILRSTSNDVLAELLDHPDWTVRVTAALELGQRGDRRANDTLIAAFREAESHTRREIAAALAVIGDEEATKLLVTALRDSQSSVRAKAAYGIAEIVRREKTPSAVRDILESASGLLLSQTLRDSDKDARDEAAVALAAIHGAKAAEMMLKALQNKSSNERLAAVKALAAMKSELGVQMRPTIQAGFIQALQDEASEVRLEAIEAIKALKSVHKLDEEVIKALIVVYQHDEDERVRNAASSALGDQRPKPLREHPTFKLASAILIIAALCWILSTIGRLIYQPKDPLPAKVSDLPKEGIYGSSESVTLLSQVILGIIDEKQEAIDSLQPVQDDAFRIPCHREIEDILLGKKDCEVLLFMARSPTASLDLHFLVFRDRGQIRSIAVGISGLTEGSPDGEFIELPENHEGEYKEISDKLRLQVVRMLDVLKSGAWTEYPPSQKDVYLPFVSEPHDLEETEKLRKSNPVVQHLLSTAANVNSDLSLGSRVFTVGEASATGMYRPGFKVIQRSMFQEPVFARTLAHELVHATLDGIEEKDALLKEIRPYLESNHPQMLQVTLPLFYAKEMADPQSETIAVEEAIAFLTGSLAAEENHVYFFIRLRPIVTDIMRDVIWLNEPLLSSDVEMLVWLGLVPEWMSPESLGYNEAKINRRYYELVNQYSYPK
jgi:HEAT repeat protein